MTHAIRFVISQHILVALSQGARTLKLLRLFVTGEPLVDPSWVTFEEAHQDGCIRAQVHFRSALDHDEILISYCCIGQLRRNPTLIFQS